MRFPEIREVRFLSGSFEKASEADAESMSSTATRAIYYASSPSSSRARLSVDRGAEKSF